MRNQHSQDENIHELVMLRASLLAFQTRTGMGGLEKFENDLESHFDIPGLARIAAEFWLGLMKEHFFDDQEGRTAKFYLKGKLAEKNIDLFTFALIDNFSIQGNMISDLRVLMTLFIVSMRPMGASLRSL